MVANRLEKEADTAKEENFDVVEQMPEYHIVPFIITDDLKFFYYRGLHEWGHIRSSSACLLPEGRKNDYLTDTCLTAQDQYKSLLDYFKIRYRD